MPPGTRLAPQARWRAGLGVFGLVAVLLALHALDHPVLTPPATTSPDNWAEWAASVGPVGLSMSLVRVAAIGLSWYLLVASVLQLLAELTGVAAVSRAADALVTARTRDVLMAVIGTSLLASVPMDTGTPPSDTAAPSVREDRAIPRMTRLDPTDHTQAPSLARLVPTDAGASPPRLQRLTGNADRAPSMARLADQDDTTPDDGTDWWTVAPGDHFWHVAEEQVKAAGAAATQGRVRAYWQCLVEVNRDRLVDPANPDLLLPGQVLRLPPASAP